MRRVLNGLLLSLQVDAALRRTAPPTAFTRALHAPQQVLLNPFQSQLDSQNGTIIYNLYDQKQLECSTAQSPREARPAAQDAAPRLRTTSSNSDSAER